MTVTINGTTGIVAPAVDALDLELNGVNVVERGSNANGQYTRFADGTQICSIELPSTGGTTVAVPGITGMFQSTTDITWNYPAAFSSIPQTVPATQRASSDSNAVWVGLRNRSIGSVEIRCYSNTSSGSLGFNYAAIAIGRWF